MPCQSLTTTPYKADIVNRMGGENMFEFILLGLVERLRTDPRLEAFFSNFDQQSLEVHQRAFLKAVFEIHPEDYDVESFIVLRHYSLINQGFSGTHFNLLVKHLVRSMIDAWVREDVIEDAIQIIMPFRRIFGEEYVEVVDEPEVEFVEPPVQEQEKPMNKSSSPRRERKIGARSFSWLTGSKRTKEIAQ